MAINLNREQDFALAWYVEYGEPAASNVLEGFWGLKCICVFDGCCHACHDLMIHLKKNQA
jgi:hypothetical protein